MQYLRRLTLSFYRNIFILVSKPKRLRIPGLKRLGSMYGGWYIDSLDELKQCYLVSAGLGEDASFDIEFVNNFETFAILVDPTPRAIAHFNDILDSAGSPKKCSYNNTGKQLIDSYDLEGINKSNLFLKGVALWTHSGSIQFHKPEIDSHVSHSLRRRNSHGSSIEVNALTLGDILLDFREKINGLDMILKLDIEGAETEVLLKVINSGHRPRQLLVEWDFMRGAKFVDILRFLYLSFRLKRSDYLFVHRENLNTLLVQTPRRAIV